MPDMTVTVSSRKIGIGPKKLGFKCGCVIFGKVRERSEELTRQRLAAGSMLAGISLVGN